MFGSYSPLMLIAGQGLLQNSGLGTNSEFSSRLSTYTSFNVVANYMSAVASTNANARMERFAADTCPALTNAIPDGYTALDPAVTDDPDTVADETEIAGNARMTAVISTQISNILGNGDYNQFTMHFNAAQSYVSEVGDIIDNVNTVNDFLGVTFDGFDSLVTGNITGLSLATQELSTDLRNTGTFIDLNNLDNFGTPQAVIQQFINYNILEYISPELVAQGINPSGLQTKLVVNNQNLKPVTQKKCYEAFKTVTGDKLTVIKQIFGIQNNNIVTLADTLDPFKLLPTVNVTLTSPTANGYRAIYANNTGSVTEHFKGKNKDFYSVLPADVADATAALKRSFQQIKGIEYQQMPAFALAVGELETNYGLGQINSLTQPLPADTYSYYTSSFASGSGENGRYYLTDIIGTPTGIHHNALFGNVNETLQELDDAGALTDIEDAFGILKNWVTGVYGTPDGSTSIAIPGYGSYTDYDAGIDAILDDVETMITTLTTNYPTQVATLISNFDAIALAIQTERTIQTQAGIDFDEPISSESAVISLVSGIPSYAVDTTVQGAGYVIENIADTSTRAGQAIVAAMREARNLGKLSTIGVTADSIPEEVTQPTDSATLSTAQYSLTEALNSVIID